MTRSWPNAWLQIGLREVGAAHGSGRLLERLVDALEDRLLAHALPDDARPVAFPEHDPAAAVVVRHDEERQRVRERALTGALEQRLELALALLVEVADPAVGVAAELLRDEREEVRQRDRDRARDHALLDHHPVVEVVLVAQVDDPGDARPDRRELAHVVVAEADPVHRLGRRCRRRRARRRCR